MFVQVDANGGLARRQRAELAQLASEMKALSSVLVNFVLLVSH
jgi:hypothetical protein